MTSFSDETRAALGQLTEQLKDTVSAILANYGPDLDDLRNLPDDQARIVAFGEANDDIGLKILDAIDEEARRFGAPEFEELRDAAWRAIADDYRQERDQARRERDALLEAAVMALPLLTDDEENPSREGAVACYCLLRDAIAGVEGGTS